MRFQYAKKLANRDEIKLKSTGEVGYVLGEPVLHPRKKNRPPWVEIPAQFSSTGYTQVDHTKVE